MSVPQRLTVLAVQADEAAHAPVRAALKALEGAEYDIHWVTTPLAALAARHGLSGLSMGMSDDFEAAIACGATHVRVGSALFGSRAPTA